MITLSFRFLLEFSFDVSQVFTSHALHEFFPAVGVGAESGDEYFHSRFRIQPELERVDIDVKIVAHNAMNLIDTQS